MTEQQKIRLQQLIDARKLSDLAVNDCAGPVDPVEKPQPPRETIKTILGGVLPVKLLDVDARNKTRRVMKPIIDEQL